MPIWIELLVMYRKKSSYSEVCVNMIFTKEIMTIVGTRMLL